MQWLLSQPAEFGSGCVHGCFFKDLLVEKGLCEDGRGKHDNQRSCVFLLDLDLGTSVHSWERARTVHDFGWVTVGAP